MNKRSRPVGVVEEEEEEEACDTTQSAWRRPTLIRPPVSKPKPPSTPPPTPPPATTNPTPPTAAQPTLPSSLHRLGNGDAWMRVAAHLRATPHLPLVVWGPTGCGKSKGIQVLLKHMGCTLVAFDGADGENARELLQWVTRTRQTTLGHTKAVLLDDFESFTPTARTSFAVELRKRDPMLSGLLITCTHFRMC